MAQLHVTGSRAALGVVAALLAAATFGTSGPFAKSLLVTGWSPLAIVTLRVGLAAVVMVPISLWLLRGRWHLVRANAGLVTAYGLVAVAGCQLAYFNAVQTLSVGVALLLEYLGIILIVGYLWVFQGKRPTRLTVLGVVLAVAGLLLVLDVAGSVRISGIGVVWGLLAAAGLATFFVISARDAQDALPPIALAGLGLGVGAVVLVLAGLVGLAPFRTATADVTLGGAQLPWWFAVGELALVAAAFAYAVGVVAVRIVGPTLASFLGLTEVLFAVVFAWLLLGELPRGIQLVGGVLVVAGVVSVRVAEAREAARVTGSALEHADFVAPTPVA